VSYLLAPSAHPRALHSSPTRRSSDLIAWRNLPRRDSAIEPRPTAWRTSGERRVSVPTPGARHHASLPNLYLCAAKFHVIALRSRSEEHTSELQSLTNIVCRLLLAKKN